jgi:DNA adenine methylase
MSLKPFVKWAGGKRQILHKIKAYFPKPEEFNNYHEPFIGAGSVFMELSNSGWFGDKDIFISDIMQPLINVYETIRDTPDELMHELDHYTQYTSEKDAFNKARQLYNSLKVDPSSQSILMAALFIYLNKTGYNGMYRENKKGEFNIPFGKHPPMVMLYHADQIKQLSCILRNPRVHVIAQNYKHGADNVRQTDFVYMDPPYYGTFSKYNKDDFGKEKHVELRDYFIALTNRGCKVALSNSNDPFIMELYANIPGVRIVEIEARRYVNSNPDKRNEYHKELLIMNYS